MRGRETSSAHGRAGLVGAVAAALAAGLLLTWLGSTPVLATAGRAAAPATAPRAAGPGHQRGRPPQALPGIDPDFVYDQLAFMATHFQHREAGYAAGASGHAGFARYWTTEMLRLLGQFGASARSYPFRVSGWAGRPATAPAVNVEVTVPGVTQPAQVVVIGCHYDGEASSTQSAFDDASGCAIELGVARAMAGFWRGRGLYPARTLRFVIFDAEEQGLYGSFSYVNDAANGSLPAIVAMINEEQNGIGYPLRFLGQLANPVLPTHLFVSPTGPGGLYRTLSLSAAQVARTRAFAALLRQAAPGSFQAFRQLGAQELTYHGAGGPVWQPIFTPDQLGELPIATDTLGSSDQVPFTLAGIPDLTIAGNYSYYTGSAAPAASYPYDQPQDTIGLMNTFADGGAGQSQALSLALAVPGMLTAWMLAQPGVLGLARPGGRPVAAIGSIGAVRPGRTVTLRATAFDPGRPRARLGYSWEFGDGAAAAGPAVRHVYAAAGHYTLQLTVTAPGQPTRVIRQAVTAGQPASYPNPYAAGPPPGALSQAARAAAEGRPPANPSVALPAARPGLGDRVGRADEVGRARAAGRAARAGRARPAGSAPTAWILTGVAALLVAAGAVVLAVRRRAGRARRRTP